MACSISAFTLSGSATPSICHKSLDRRGCCLTRAAVVDLGIERLQRGDQVALGIDDRPRMIAQGEQFIGRCLGFAQRVADRHPVRHHHPARDGFLGHGITPDSGANFD